MKTKKNKTKRIWNQKENENKKESEQKKNNKEKIIMYSSVDY